MNNTEEHFNVSFDRDKGFSRLVIGKYVNGIMKVHEAYYGPEAEIKYQKIKNAIELNIM